VLARDYIATFKLLPLYDIESAGCARRSRRAPECRDAVGGGCRMLAPDALRARLMI
jgi:sulfur relay (sulfurtransferase) DsrF/TusC family protein